MKGRESCFKCTFCGRFLPYDRRIIEVRYDEVHIFDNRDETYDLDYESYMYHKKCKTKTELRSTK